MTALQLESNLYPVQSLDFGFKLSRGTCTAGHSSYQWGQNIIAPLQACDLLSPGK